MSGGTVVTNNHILVWNINVLEVTLYLIRTAAQPPTPLHMMTYPEAKDNNNNNNMKVSDT